MKHPIDAAGNRVYLSEFEFECNDYFGYDDMLEAVYDDAYQTAVSNLDVDGTEPDTEERWQLWEADAARVRSEFEKFYKDQLLVIASAHSYK